MVFNLKDADGRMTVLVEISGHLETVLFHQHITFLVGVEILSGIRPQETVEVNGLAVRRNRITL